MNPDNLSRIEAGVSHYPQGLWITPVDNYSRPATNVSSTSLTENAPQPEHWANHSCSVSSAPLVMRCSLRPSP